MFWPKKHRELDFTGVTPEQLGTPQLDLDGVSAGGAARPISIHAGGNGSPMEWHEAWQRIGERAWDILEKKRLVDLAPPGDKSEFELYRELIKDAGGDRRKEVFVGLRHRLQDPPAPSPLFVPREVFQRHSYILGATGFGKTSHAIAQLLIQLSEKHPWIETDESKPGAAADEGQFASILIIDMKPTGDTFLRALAEDLAKQQGRAFRFFSTAPELQSVQFDPFTLLRLTPYPLERVEMLLKAFSLIYPEGYGSDFFTSEQRRVLTQVMYDTKPQNFTELVRFVREAVSSKSNADARGLLSALMGVQRALHLNADARAVPPDQDLDFNRFLAAGEIVYVHLDSRGTYLLGRDVGKLMLFTLLKIATDRYKRRDIRQAFVVIDEFQRLAAANIVEMLEDARAAGIGFILAHQSASALETRDRDLYGPLFENCAFKQCLTLENKRVIELLTLISGQTTERVWGGSRGWNSGEQTTSSWSQARSTGTVTGVAESNDGRVTNSKGTSDSNSDGTGGATARTVGQSGNESWEDTLRPGLTPELIAAVNNVELLSLVHVKGATKGVTPTGGVPVLVQGLFPVSKKEYLRMSDQVWPAVVVEDAEYYRRESVEIPQGGLDAVEASIEGGRSARRKPEKDRSRRPGAAAEKRNELEQKLRPVFEKLSPGMLGEFVAVETVARTLGIRVKQLWELIAALGLPIDTRETHLRADHVAAVESHMRSFAGGGDSAAADGAKR